MTFQDDSWQRKLFNILGTVCLAGFFITGLLTGAAGDTVAAGIFFLAGVVMLHVRQLDRVLAEREETIAGEILREVHSAREDWQQEQGAGRRKK
jgi:hypothetical protein